MYVQCIPLRGQFFEVDHGHCSWLHESEHALDIRQHGSAVYVGMVIHGYVHACADSAVNW